MHRRFLAMIRMRSCRHPNPCVFKRDARRDAATRYSLKQSPRSVCVTMRDADPAMRAPLWIAVLARDCRFLRARHNADVASMHVCMRGRPRASTSTRTHAHGRERVRGCRC